MTSRLTLMSLLAGALLVILAVPALAAVLEATYTPAPEQTLHFNPKEVGIDKSVPWLKANATLHLVSAPQGASVAVGFGDLSNLKVTHDADFEAWACMILPYQAFPDLDASGNLIRRGTTQVYIEFDEPVPSAKVAFAPLPKSAKGTDIAMEELTLAYEGLSAKQTKYEYDAAGNLTGILIGLNQPGIIAILIGL